MEEKQVDLVKCVEEAHVFGESDSCVFSSYTLFEDVVSKLLQMVGVLAEGEHMDSRFEPNNKHFHLALQVGENSSNGETVFGVGECLNGENSK